MSVTHRTSRTSGGKKSTSRTTMEKRSTRRDDGRSQSVVQTLLMEDVEVDDHYSDYDGSDNEFDFPDGFDEMFARQQLFKFKDCSKIVLSLEQQKLLGLEIGVNVTAEHPWKQLTRSLLYDNLGSDTPQAVNFRKLLPTFDADELILVGYAAPLSEEEDTFLFFENSIVAQEAGVLISQVEASERRKTRRAQIKHPRKWQTHGSEVEVEKMMPPKRPEKVEVEVQSLYPVKHSQRPFVMRRTGDARDGYVELVPTKIEVTNVVRKRVDMVIQSGLSRVNVEQQTDPTFPTNAWSQYFFEIGQDKVDDVENEDDEDEPVRKKRGNKEPVIPVIPSDRVQQMLDSLEFNEVNMYRNDYPLIGKEVIPKYKAPYMTESFSFIMMEKTIGRYVSSIDWHPNYSGMLVAAYTFSTSATVLDPSNKTDEIKRAVLEPNPVIMWSFDDILYPKLELETSREISCISYCPYDENLVVGGTMNGQIVIWDLNGRLKKVESAEVLSAAQSQYRTAMNIFLNWTKRDDGDRIVRPAAISALQHSHKAAVTSIQWLGRDSYVSANGCIKLKDKSDNSKYRYFITTSMDCHIAFWDLDFVDEAEARKPGAQRKLKLPAHMVEQTSEYLRHNNILRPQFMLVFNRHMTASMMDCGIFNYESLYDAPQPRRQDTRVRHRIVAAPGKQFEDRMTVATVTGGVISIRWYGSDMVAEIIKKEVVKKIDTYAPIHSGIVETLSRNPFLKDLFLSVGRNVLVLWRMEFWTPIFWRNLPSKICSVQWSKTRAAVFFVIRGDGSVEAWDLLSRTDGPCLVDSLGGNILTAISQHKLSLPIETLVVGDCNSSIRTLQIPNSFSKPHPNEVQQLQAFIDREVARLEFVSNWQKKFYEANSDIRAARLLAAQEAQQEAERLEKEYREQEDMRLKKEEAEERRAYAKAHSKMVFDMPERLERKWDESNIRRLMKILMSMKQVDPQLLAKWTKPEKDRLKYCARKQAAIDESFSRIAQDVADMRAKLIPAEKFDEGRKQFVRQNLQQILLPANEEMEVFEAEQTYTREYIAEHNQRETLDYAGILKRGRHRREVINKALGSNTQHRHTYYGGSAQQLVGKTSDTSQHTDNLEVVEEEGLAGEGY